MKFKDILYHTDGGVATITLNRPDRYNAFSKDMLEGWVFYLEQARDDDGINVILVTGKGKAFCAGGDVKYMSEGKGFIAGVEPPCDGPPASMLRKESLTKLVHRVALTLEGIDKPVICAVNGPAMGAGLDMALMCDLRIASDQAAFGESYIKVGLVPGDGGAYFLPRLVGLAKALEMLWFGDTLDARQALQAGLVNKVVAAEDFPRAAADYARRLAEGPPLAVRLIKRAVYSGLSSDLHTALDLISSHMAIASETRDHQEAVKAFLEKRKPKFVGK